MIVDDVAGADRTDAKQAFAVDGGPVGVLLCHGFTGSPASMRPWAEVAAAAGHTVRLPRLPGHGSTIEAANRVSWADWFDCVDRAFEELAARCEQVFVFALSMGGGLALRIAQVHADRVAGLVLVNPSVTVTDKRLLFLPVLRRISASSPGITDDIAQPGQTEGGLTRVPHNGLATMLAMNKTIRRDLGLVRAPILLFRSENDHVVGPESAVLIETGVRGPFERRNLTRSFHVATLDYEAEEIFAASLAFVADHQRQPLAQSQVAAS